VITADTMQEVFGMTSVIINDPVSNTLTVVPIRRHLCRGGEPGFLSPPV